MQEITEKEQEEDLLEQIYIWNQKENCDFQNLNLEGKFQTEETEYLIQHARNHGYLTKDSRELRLTPYGRERAEMILNRHEYLTAFLQVICNVEEKTAEENACRIEHVISEDVFMGICEFMHHGPAFSRRIRIHNLRFFYDNGMYRFTAFLYEPEERYPRVLSSENKDIESEILAKIGEKSFFYLGVKENFPWKKVWYMGDDNWQEAIKTKRGYQMPGDIFMYTVNNSVFSVC